VTSLADLIASHLAAIDTASVPVFVLDIDYPSGTLVDWHKHRRAQLLYVRDGIAQVSTQECHWLVPAAHALWIPAGVEHSILAARHVTGHFVYVEPEMVGDLPTRGRVVGLTPLMRSLVAEFVALPADGQRDRRAQLIAALILAEIPFLLEMPLGLPMPTDGRLLQLCRRFVERPTPRETTDDWARAMAMSRRSFTRRFRAETGLSFLVWRRQACLFAALPRLSSGEAVTTVALDLGYDSPAAFTTMFRRSLGLPPRDYVRRGPA
jgi:AraC-like DNA-binding protein